MAKILLIEDDPLVSRMYSKAFEIEGIEASVAHNGEMGLAAARETNPDLIFCDVMMPNMNGFVVLENLKSNEKTKNIPVVMLTNLSGTHDAENALEKGAAGYLVKSEYKPMEIAKKARGYLKSIVKEEKK